MFRPKNRPVVSRKEWQCFNPCSRGCFARSRMACRPSIGERVSILVLVDVSPEARQITNWTPDHQDVSILVLVDVSPEAAGLVLLSGHSGFNPCSRGCFARSILGCLGETLALKFQSLFSWMFRPKPAHSIGRSRAYLVSILVLVDVSPEAARRQLPARPSTCFNPCSRGCFARRTLFRQIRPMFPGFNPCSRGCFARRVLSPLVR